jgi:hypothetical protein
LSLKHAILSLLFTLGFITQIWADPIKSINNAANQETTMKMNKNEIAIEEKTRPAKNPNASLKKHKAKFQSGTSYIDDGVIMSSKKYGVNFLKIVKEREKPLLTEPLDRVIYSCKFSQDAGREEFSNFQEVTKTTYSNSDFGQFIPRPYQNGNKYLEEERTLTTLKLLQAKKEEIFKEIFLGFRFSFNPMNGHRLLEMNITPSFEKGPGITIPF